MGLREMSESRKAKATEAAIRARYDARFWDEVERELEAFDAADFAEFVAAGRLPIEPQARFRESLLAHLCGVARACFSN